MTNINTAHIDPGQALTGSFDLPNGALRVLGMAGSLVPDQYDQISLTYIAAGPGAGEIYTVTYKLSGTSICILTLTYDGSNRLIDVVRS